jgi:hypothetical protein
VEVPEVLYMLVFDFELFGRIPVNDLQKEKPPHMYRHDNTYVYGIFIGTFILRISNPKYNTQSTNVNDASVFASILFH